MSRVIGAVGRACMAFITTAAIACASFAADSSPPTQAPNIVLILLDDVGFAAASGFGGPVQTPELDRLAARGLKYNRFHVAALCSPTRAALLSGRNSHQIGFGAVDQLINPSLPGYDGIWRKSAASIAEVLKRSGYSTAAIGKWHNTPPREISPIGPFERWPTGLGFEYFYGFMAGMENQWEPSALYRNTTAVEAPAKPREGYHFTADITNDAIRWVQTQRTLAPGKPYFLYFAPTATHVPHHVPKEWIDRYRGKFDQGWDALRQETFARQKQLGVVPASAKLTRRPPELAAWSELSAAQKTIATREMEVYAAFMAHTDHEVGRLLRTVQQLPGGDNTLILYIVGDNGADAFFGTETNPNTGAGRRSSNLPALLEQLDAIGTPASFATISGSWAWAMNTPFQWTKTIASHLGGTRNPLIVSWPARIKDHGGLRSQFTHVNDVAATLYEAAQVSLPATIDGVPQQPLEGTSFAYTFDDAHAPSRHHTQIFEDIGNRAIYRDGWVAAARHRFPWTPWILSDFNSPEAQQDFDRDRWELYHIEQDFSQANDLADRRPAKLQEMQALFEQEARRTNIVLKRTYSSALVIPAASKEYVYHCGFPRLWAIHAPRFNESSHVITADVVIPQEGAQGVLISWGSRLGGGFALYIKDDHLVYESGSAARGRKTIVSSAPVPHGPVTVKFEFSKGSSGQTGRLFVNDEPVSAAEPLNLGATDYFGTLGIGQAYGSPVSTDFETPFEFTGTLNSVHVQLK